MTTSTELSATPPDAAHLPEGPFTRIQARAAGVSDRMLDGSGYVRVFPRVWRRRGHEMTQEDRVHAATMCLPARAHLTGITRLQQLGLDFGPRELLRFVVVGDLHLAPPGIFLHRTKKLPALDEIGVTPAAAFVAYCRQARALDAVKVGDWLLGGGHATPEELRSVALAEPWRDGSHELLWILEHLDSGSRSLMESETRVVLTFSGLPRPETNGLLDLADDAVAYGDLLYRQFRAVVEYEGSHHQTDRGQYACDLDRYALLRDHDIAYVQVTREKLRHSRTLVGEVFRLLVSRGYDGPPPVFGGGWRSLFRPLSDLARPDRGTAPGSQARVG